MLVLTRCFKSPSQEHHRKPSHLTLIVLPNFLFSIFTLLPFSPFVQSSSSFFFKIAIAFKANSQLCWLVRNWKWCQETVKVKALPSKKLKKKGQTRNFQQCWISITHSCSMRIMLIPAYHEGFYIKFISCEMCLDTPMSNFVFLVYNTHFCSYFDPICSVLSMWWRKWVAYEFLRCLFLLICFRRRWSGLKLQLRERLTLLPT